MAGPPLAGAFRAAPGQVPAAPGGGARGGGVRGVVRGFPAAKERSGSCGCGTRRSRERPGEAAVQRREPGTACPGERGAGRCAEVPAAPGSTRRAAARAAPRHGRAEPEPDGRLPERSP